MSFTWTARDMRQSRAYTVKLTELAEEGAINWETLARDLMGWMSEDEVQQFALANDYLPEAYEDELEDEDA